MVPVSMAVRSTSPRLSTPRVALVHEWLVTMRGAERVLEVFAELFPDAPIYTLVHRPGALSPALERRDIRTSFLQKLPFGVSKYRHYLPLMPAAIESLDLSGFDAVLSSSFCVAKGVITRPDARHVSYCHTPMRYVWEQQHEYFGEGRASPLVRAHRDRRDELPAHLGRGERAAARTTTSPTRTTSRGGCRSATAARRR